MVTRTTFSERAAVAAWRRAGTDPRVRTAALAVYYVGIVLALAWLYGSAGIEPPAFIYQGF